MLENMKNRVNCWDDLSSFLYNVIGNDERDRIKSKRVEGLISSQAPEQSDKSMGKVHRLTGERDYSIIQTRVLDTKVMI